MSLKLSRKIPARIETIYFHWCGNDYTTMSQSFRNIRSKCHDPMDTCFWCSHKFLDGEQMALVQPIRGANKVLCQKCANELLDSESKDEK